MRAEQALLDAYSEWRRLAAAEGRAIQRRNWNLLLECQQSLKKIQPLIADLSRKMRDEWKQSGVDFVAKEKNIHTVVSELIDLTNHNQVLLDRARQTALTKREQLEQAGRNLKRLQLSYAFARPPAWTSFS